MVRLAFGHLDEMFDLIDALQSGLEVWELDATNGERELVKLDLFGQL